MLGLVGFSDQIPAFFLAPVGGVVADRWNRHRILILTQFLAMVQALVLAALTISNKIAPWHIIALNVFLGFINAFDMTARQSFVVEMVENREDLGNAIALNSSMFNSARLIGPSVAGLLIANGGEWVCFLLNGISYPAVIVALLAMRTAPRKISGKTPAILRELRDGFSYAYHSPTIRSLLVLLATVSLTGVSYAVLLPVFAREVLHGASHTYGFLVGASGLGALTGAYYLASRSGVKGLGKVIAAAGILFGLALVVFSFSRALWLSLALMLLTGFGMIVQMASSNTLLQTIVEDDKRGRIMSLYTMAFMGMAPVGSLLAGALAGRIGAPVTMLICGASCVLSSLVFVGYHVRLRGGIGAH